jgi:hypothetical protein
MAWMNPWPAILLWSAVSGTVSGLLLRRWLAVVVAGAVAWLGVAAWVLYEEYGVTRVIDYSKGPSMWPIALVLAGTVAAVVGASTAAAVGRLRRNERLTAAEWALAAVALLMFIGAGPALVLALTHGRWALIG